MKDPLPSLYSSAVKVVLFGTALDIPANITGHEEEMGYKNQKVEGKIIIYLQVI